MCVAFLLGVCVRCKFVLNIVSFDFGPDALLERFLFSEKANEM